MRIIWQDHEQSHDGPAVVVVDAAATAAVVAATTASTFGRVAPNPY